MTNELEEIAAKLEDEKAITDSIREPVPKLRPLTREKVPRFLPQQANRSKPRDLSYQRHDGQLEKVSTLAEHFQNGTYRRESKPLKLISEETVILTQRSKSSNQSKAESKTINKLSKFQNAWGVSEETAKLMLKRERIMKGLLKRGVPHLLTFN